MEYFYDHTSLVMCEMCTKLGTIQEFDLDGLFYFYFPEQKRVKPICGQCKALMEMEAEAKSFEERLFKFP